MHKRWLLGWYKNRISYKALILIFFKFIKWKTMFSIMYLEEKYFKKINIHQKVCLIVFLVYTINRTQNDNISWIQPDKTLRVESKFVKWPHTKFLSLNSGVKISLSKFSKLRPRKCILTDQKGMHNDCVCKKYTKI